MNNRKQKELMSKTKEELVLIIDAYRKQYCYISETLVDESKQHISKEKAIDNIRKYLVDNQHDIYC